MQATRRLLQQRQPLIKFVGRRHQIPSNIDHSPHVHPAAPSSDLPESFASYREKATQHGPLKSSNPQTPPPSSTTSSSSAAKPPQQNPLGAIGAKSAKELGPIKIGKGEFLDRNELPARFHRMRWSQAEIDAVESGGASIFV